MGVVLSRAELVKGLEPLATFDVAGVRAVYEHFEEICPTPALWERAFHELLGCFGTADASSRAFVVLDTDSNGLVDARETIGALAVLCKGHLSDRMSLLYEIYDLQKEREMAFDECFMMLRRTMAGLRKMIGILAPPEKVVYNMTKQIWKAAKKHRDNRILADDWHAWWSSDASIRSALKMVTWKPEDQRGLPTQDRLSNIDYTKGIADLESKRSTSRHLNPDPSPSPGSGMIISPRWSHSQVTTPLRAQLAVPGAPSDASSTRGGSANTFPNMYGTGL